jgi:phospholipid N-methyltransferase
MITATYSPDDNKLRLYCSTRLDAETYAKVRAAGFIWAAKQDLFVAPAWSPEREDLCVELAGDVGDEDTSLTDRAEERAERFDGYQDNRREDADRAHAAVSAIADGIPFGQPILVGHHSERHARRDAEKIENGMRRAVKAWKTAEYWKYRAAGAIRHAKYKERPDVRARRIKTIEADRRKSLRNKDAADRSLRLWQTVADPDASPIRRKDGTPMTTRDRALAIANTEHGYAVWSDLDANRITGEEAQTTRIAQITSYLPRLQRWIDHYDRRLEYERAMLAESGYVAPVPTRSAKAELPLLNYPGPVAYRNPYQRHEIIRTEAIGITSAQWAAIHTDYKATRISEDGTHRVRTAMHVPGAAKFSLSAVYLTDKKTHDKPSAETAEATKAAEEDGREAALERATAALQARLDRQAAERPAREAEAAEAAPFQQMAESLRAGIQTVSAPQLFPTPRDVADRLVALADLDPGLRVLEPSAGTGRLLDAIATTASVELVAVEIANLLCRRINTHPAVSRVVEADFLTLDAEALGGPFDRIVMNPPFTRGQGVAHVEHARRLLKPGGRLAAILPGDPARYTDLPDVEHVEALPDGSFKESGTNVCASIVLIVAPAQ